MPAPVNTGSHTLSALVSSLPSMKVDLKQAMASVTVMDPAALKSDFVGVLGGLNPHPVGHLPTANPIRAIGGPVYGLNPHPIPAPIVLPLSHHSS